MPVPIFRNSTDEQFVEKLRGWLWKRNGRGPVKPRVSVFRNTDGSINREKTLAGPDFAALNKKKGMKRALQLAGVLCVSVAVLLLAGCGASRPHAVVPRGAGRLHRAHQRQRLQADRE
jgi:hypothetical protein